jgi:putative ABC transport system permease protein
LIKNYIKIAARSLWRNKSFSAINIFGLAIGIATCVIIMLFVKQELNYDQHHVKGDDIVRVVFRGQVKGQQMKEANVFPPVAHTLKKDFPEVEQAVRLSVGGAPVVTMGDKNITEKNLAYIDPEFFQVFTIPFVAGNPATALSEPNTVVITQKIARKYFGEENAIGKVMTFKNFGRDYKVTGVINEIPQASHFHFDIFASLKEVADAASDSWMTSSYYTYLLLKPGTDYRKLEAKLPMTVQKYMGPQFQQAMGISLKEFSESGNSLGLFLQPLKEIHLHSDLTNDLEPAGDISYVYIFGAIAVFMLLIACINFMNLSTASAGKRAKEVGIRKVMGSLQRQLIWQFLTESFIITAIAMAIAIVFVQMALPAFNGLSGKNLTLSYSFTGWFMPMLLVTGLVTAFFAGIYPAFVLSSFNPIKVLKGKWQGSKGGVGLRTGLVVFQFSISIILMVATAVVFNQLSFIRQKKLGYNKEQVLIVPAAIGLGQSRESLIDVLRQDPAVASFTSSGYLPAGPTYGNNFFIFEKDSKSQIKSLRYEIDENYLATLGMELKEGRNFSNTFGTDSLAIIINESAAKDLGFRDSIIGRTIHHADNNGINKSYHVIGVVKDFHFKSLHQKISPLVMTFSRGFGQLIVKVKTNNISGVLQKLEAAWAELKSDQPFQYSFLDEQFYNTYKAEQNTGKILAIFAGLTIFVACLGLFGLATFTIAQRNKEIGIRKVLGASVSGIVVLLTRDFIRMVALAFIIAAPIAWLLMNKWLENFEYRQNIAWWIFGLAAFAAFFITIITVGYRGLRAAATNPAVVLKNE